MAGVSRVSGVSETYLQDYINEKYDKIQKVVQTDAKKGKLTLQCDEMYSFAGNKENKVWIWFALDVITRKIVGCHIGDRDREGAGKLWLSLPPVYRQCAVCYTDFWSAYEEIFPIKRHKQVSKNSGKTSYIEKFNCTVRQRISRLVRKTLSFSKKIENHIGAVWNFIHHYNENLPLHV